jgi:2-dehydro-3-deoxygalactonokinase
MVWACWPGGRERFSAALAQLCRQMGVADHVPVLMSGMVGSASGWQEVDYLDSSIPVQQLPAHLAALQDPAWAGRCHIVPATATAAALPWM